MREKQLNEIRLRYRDTFRSVYGEAFQHWFESIAPLLHGEACFVGIRVTKGDGGLDGLVLREGHVYQLYAPVRPHSDPLMSTKIKADFEKAKSTLQGSLKAWTFLHNSPDARIGHRAAVVLRQLQEAHSLIRIDVLDINSLWDQLERVPLAKLSSVFGLPEDNQDHAQRVREMLRRAGDLQSEDRTDEAFILAQEALVAIADRDDLLDLRAKTLASLILLSSTRSSRGDARHYAKLLLPLRDQIKDPSVLLLSYRAEGSVLAESGDTVGADVAYLAAIDVATQSDKADCVALDQCVVRAEYIHLLSSMRRFDDATRQLALIRAYATANPEELDGDIHRLVFNATLHLAAENTDEDAAIEAVRLLEADALTTRRAMKVAGTLLNGANGLAQSHCYRAALIAAETALRLAGQIPADRQTTFIPGVLYTIAMIHYSAGRLEQALEKAKSVASLNATNETASVRFAATQLVSVISRDLGDFEQAVDKGKLAVDLANETDSAFMARMNLANSFGDQGETERALETAQDAYHLVEGRPTIPTEMQLRAAATVGTFAAQLGRQDIVLRSTEKVVQLAGDDPLLIEQLERYRARIDAFVSIRAQMRDISLVQQTGPQLKKELAMVNEFRQFVLTGKSPKPDMTVPIASLREANALTIAPVLRWWDDTDQGDDKAVALHYDCWGRGGFARILRNLQAFPHQLNVAVEVRSVDDVRNALRLWTLYADFILLLWKGPTESGRFVHMIDGEWFGPWGAGYMLAMRDQYESKSGRLRFPALSHGSWLPADIARCLATEARPFLESGRALLVPASGVGCITPGHGVLEQLLSEVANCIPALQNRQESELQIGLLPYARDIPLGILFDFVGQQEDALVEMRRLILAKTEAVRKNGFHSSSRAMERELTDALRLLRQENATVARQRKLSAAEQDARVGIAPFHLTGGSLIQGNHGSFAPLLTLESIGYGWKVGAEPSLRPPRYEPGEEEAVGTWLAPPKCGFSILTRKAVGDATGD